MTEITKEQILDAVANMKVSDLVELTKQMEDKFGVSGERIFGGPVQEVVVEDTGPKIVSVVLISYGDRKINIVKEVRNITGLGLKESMALVNETPSVIRSDIEIADAEVLKKKLEDAGGQVEFK